MSYHGKYRPVNAQKYIGNLDKITFRSLWEKKCFEFFDMNDSVMKWSSEPLSIPYISPVDNKHHRYFPDMYVMIRKPDGVVEELLIEVKPHKESIQPERKDVSGMTKPQRRSYIKEVCTYATNQAKWEAAKQVCKQQGWIFKIWTEKIVKF